MMQKFSFHSKCNVSNDILLDNLYLESLCQGLMKCLAQVTEYIYVHIHLL